MSPADDNLIGQNEVDVRNEARRAAWREPAEWPEDNHAGTRYEGPRLDASPREKEDEARYHEYEFGTQEFADEEDRDKQLRSSDRGQPEGWKRD